MPVLDWPALEPEVRRRVLSRPALEEDGRRAAEVRRILAQVRADGDHALRLLTRRYDGCEIGELWVAEEELAAAAAALEPGLRAALERSIARLVAFHAAQGREPISLETAPGLRCERILRPLRRVGLYVPAGAAPLPSTLLMLAVPARLAGCAEIVVATPPGCDGRIDPGIAAAAHLLGLTRVARIGGAQAIAALAYGTESIPRCDKIFGPGNAWVTEAKRQVAADPEGAAIDLPAGPSEVLVIADASARPAWVAADLLAQAEHGPEAQAIALSPERELLEAVAAEIELQAPRLGRAGTLAKSLGQLRLVRVAGLEEAFALANAYAPEHLILALAEPRAWLPRVEAAGAVFLGHWTPEALGDYTSGPNHVLPTYGWARALSGLGLESFQLAITVQEASPAALARVGPDAVRIARAEGLEGHAASILCRLEARP
ncbi:MAG: histidinol dehydrogenase [Xanthomonadales bacterium]|nr:histidinol dehydrogenase [Xanthomonadales bacterium]